jgi:thioredoxin reductase (NADPH)
LAVIVAENSVDLVVIGAGVAGLSAAATAASRGLRVLVFEQLMPGGQIATIGTIRNFPAFPGGIGGHEVGPLLLEQAEAAGAEFRLDTVTAIEPDGTEYRVVGGEQTIRARAIVLAMGSSRRALDAPGEKELEGRGVSHCASCDGYFFRDKAVVVAGGGDSAFDEAEILAEQAAQVTIVHRGARPVAQQRTLDRVSALPNVRILSEAEIVAVQGADEVESVLVRSMSGQTIEAASGLFVYIGLSPNSGIVANLVETDKDGRIMADEGFRTSRPGLFVAGDLRSGATELLASAMGDGAGAAVAAANYLTGRPKADAPRGIGE